MRTFTFDDGQLWHMELTRVRYQAEQVVGVGARFWAAGTPDQRILTSLPGQSLAWSEPELAAALREALRGVADVVAADA
jgi:hypothetical protein